jgi:hypothetical protein
MEGGGVEECPRGVRRTQRGEAVRYTARVVCLREGVKTLGEFASTADASQVLRGLHAPPPQGLCSTRMEVTMFGGPRMRGAHQGRSAACACGAHQGRSAACFTAV